jgi:hypothetical protein
MKQRLLISLKRIQMLFTQVQEQKKNCTKTKKILKINWFKKVGNWVYKVRLKLLMYVKCTVIFHLVVCSNLSFHLYILVKHLIWN